MRQLRGILIGLSLIVGAPAFAGSLDEARALRQQAAQAEKDGDIVGAISAFEQALTIQPGHPSYWLNLAIWEKQQGHDVAALGWLNKFANAGLTFDPDRLAGYLKVDRDDARFSGVLNAIAANARPVGKARNIAVFDQVDALTESMSVDRNRLYLGTIADGRIWRREDKGDFAVFIDDPAHLVSAFSLAVDHVRGVLWVTSGTLPQSPKRDETAWKSGLLAYDLQSGKFIKGVDMGDDASMLGDLLQTKDGTLYAADGQSGAVWKFSPDLDQREKLPTGEQLSSPQGMAELPGGLLIADYSTGLWLWGAETLHHVQAPDNVSLIGLDGMARAGDRVIAIQNGVNPKRVLSLTLSEDGRRLTRWNVLAQNLPGMEEPTQGLVHQNEFWFVANAQWATFPDDGAAPKTPRQPVNILAVELPSH